MSSHGTGAMSAAVRMRLVQLLGMIGSAHDGERANAAALADRLVRDLGLTWDQVVAQSIRLITSRHDQDLFGVDLCRACPELFSAKQIDFLGGLATWPTHRGALTPKQRAALDDMLERVEAREGRAA